MSATHPEPSTVRVGDPDGAGGLVERASGHVGGLASTRIDTGAREVAHPATIPTMDRLREAIDRLLAEADVLTTRLGPVLGSGSPHPASEPRIPAGDSELVKLITEQAVRLEGLYDHLSGLVNRLEV